MGHECDHVGRATQPREGLALHPAGRGVAAAPRGKRASLLQAEPQRQGLPPRPVWGAWTYAAGRCFVQHAPSYRCPGPWRHPPRSWPQGSACAGARAIQRAESERAAIALMSSVLPVSVSPAPAGRWARAGPAGASIRASTRARRAPAHRHDLFALLVRQEIVQHENPRRPGQNLRRHLVQPERLHGLLLLLEELEAVERVRGKDRQRNRNRQRLGVGPANCVELAAIRLHGRAHMQLLRPGRGQGRGGAGAPTFGRGKRPPALSARHARRGGAPRGDHISLGPLSGSRPSRRAIRARTGQEVAARGVF